MKIVVFSDVHVFPFVEHATLVDGVNSRLLDTLKVFEKARRYCKRHDIKHVVIGGDVFHKRGMVPTQALNLVVAELAAYKKRGIRVIVVDGNHDHADRGGMIHAVEALRSAGLVEAIPPGEGFGLWDLGGVPMHGFSYCDDRTLFQKRIDDARKTTRERGLAVFHAGFFGARVGTYLEYEVREPISAKKRIGNEWPLVLSGHYHSHQPIRGIENGWYIGSPMEFTRASIDELHDKGFMVVDLDSLTFEMIPLRLPKFLRISSMDFDLPGVLEDVAGNFVDVDVLPGEENVVSESLRDAGARAWKTIPRQKEEDENRKERFSVDPSIPPRQALAALLETKEEEIAEKGLSKKDLLDMGRLFLSKASEV